MKQSFQARRTARESPANKAKFSSDSSLTKMCMFIPFSGLIQSAVLCGLAISYAVLCCLVFCFAIVYYVLLCIALLCFVVLCCTLLFYGVCNRSFTGTMLAFGCLLVYFFISSFNNMFSRTHYYIK